MKNHRLIITTASLCGIVAPILHLGESIINGAMQPGYSWQADTVSELAQFQNGWIQDATFIIFGLLVIVFAFGLNFSIEQTKYGKTGIFFLFLFGLFAIGGGVFPEPITGIGVHGVVAFIAFITVIIGMFFLFFRLKQDQKWKRYTWFTIISAFLGLVFLYVWLGIVQPKWGLAIHDPERISSAFGQWIGISQRLALIFWLVWIEVMSIKLWTIRK
jgi:hypothetical membrane protein